MEVTQILPHIPLPRFIKYFYPHHYQIKYESQEQDLDCASKRRVGSGFTSFKRQKHTTCSHRITKNGSTVLEDEKANLENTPEVEVFQPKSLKFQQINNPDIDEAIVRRLMIGRQHSQLSLLSLPDKSKIAIIIWLGV